MSSGPSFNLFFHTSLLASLPSHSAVFSYCLIRENNGLFSSTSPWGESKIITSEMHRLHALNPLIPSTFYTTPPVPSIMPILEKVKCPSLQLQILQESKCLSFDGVSFIPIRGKELASFWKIGKLIHKTQDFSINVYHFSVSPLKNTDRCYYPFITNFQDQPDSDAGFVTLRTVL